MFIIDAIKVILGYREIMKYERTMVEPKVRNRRRPIEEKTEQKADVEIDPAFKGKEGAALCMLLAAASTGNESAMDDACDLIKQLGLIDGYK